MGTKRAKGNTTYYTIRQGKTQRATAEAIYDHILAHPKDVPADTAKSGHLTYVLGGTEPACVEISNYNGLNLAVWPGTATTIQTERGWAANRSDKIGRGRLISNPHSLSPDNRAEDVHNIRLIVGRALRHQAKEVARVETQIERRRAHEGPGVRLIPATDR